MGNILRPPFYILSDTHFGHERIVELQGRPYDHEVMMRRRWQRTVRQSDTVLHLGDLVMGGQAGYDHFREEVAPYLPGKKFLILGNHDRKKWDYAALGFTVIKPFSVTYRGFRVSFDHYPKLLDQRSKLVHIHGHIHSNGYGYEGALTRWGNINTSVEVLDYRPHRVTRLINAEIRRRRQSQRYLNSRHRRLARR